MSRSPSKAASPSRSSPKTLSVYSAMAAADEGAIDLQSLAIIEIGLPNYSDLQYFPVEVALAYFDSRSAASWLVEPEERWSSMDVQRDSVGDQELGSGMHASAIVGQLKSAVSGTHLVSRNPAHVNLWLQRLFSACGDELTFAATDLRSLVFRAGPNRKAPTADNMDRARQWSRRKVPGLSRVVTDAARDVIYLQELDRMMCHP